MKPRDRFRWILSNVCLGMALAAMLIRGDEVVALLCLVLAELYGRNS